MGIIIAIVFILIALEIYLAAKYPKTKFELRLIGFFYTLFNGFDSMEGLLEYAKKPDKSIPALSGPDNIEISEDEIEGCDKNRIPVFIYRSKDIKPDAAGLLRIHGGAYAYGAPRRDERFFKPLAANTNTVCVVPEYRLSLQAKYPAAFNDGVSSLIWLKEHAKELGINKDQIFVGGCSAGGGMAAALALYARNTGLVNIAFQILIYPMLNDKMDTPSMKGNKELIWNERQNALSWELYLGDLYKTDDVDIYAAPSREKDLSGMPAAYSFTGTLDPVCDETKEYFDLLKKCGVEAECDIYEGAYHGFDAVPSKTAKKARARLLEKYKYAAENCFAEQK